MRVIWTRAAQAQKDAIWEFWAERAVNHADRVELRLEDRVKSLAWLPRQGRPVTDVVRRLSCPDIRYIIDYRIDEDAIRILRVRSTSQGEEA